ncbi:MAG: helix-turn-helix domain-containing protein [Bacillota bacterium]|nr:helix-turn-helix domain-containing protein [Bacillota bacterium]
MVIRAHILLDRVNGISIRKIASIYNLSTNTVRLCIDKYISGGTDSVLFDEQRAGRPVEITDDAKSWIFDLACQKTYELDYSAELWTLPALHKHICTNAEATG